MERKVSSVVLREEYLGGHQVVPQENVRYVEVPVVEEIIKHVPRREVVEVEKRVPRIEYQYVDREVEVPEIQYVDRVVEVPEVQEEVRLVPKIQHVEVPREVIERVPKVETRYIEKFIDVPGEITEVPRPYVVEKAVYVPNYVPKENPVIVAQTLRPVVCPSSERIQVPVTEWRPQIIEYPIPVAKVVDIPILNRGLVRADRHNVTVSQKEYEQLLRRLNPHLNQEQMAAVSHSFPQTGYYRNTADTSMMIHGDRPSMYHMSPINTIPLMPATTHAPIPMSYASWTRPPGAPQRQYVDTYGSQSMSTQIYPSLYNNQLTASGVRLGGPVVGSATQLPVYESDRGNAFPMSNVQPYGLSRGAFSPIQGAVRDKHKHKKHGRGSQKSKK